MFVSHLFITLLAASATLVNGAIAPRATNTPCQFTCPLTDLNGNNLVSDTEGGTNSGLRCNYSVLGDKNCRYGRYTGELRNDNDDTYCRLNPNNPNGCTYAVKRAMEERKRTFEAYNSAKRTADIDPEVKKGMERARNLRVAKAAYKAETKASK